VAGWRRSSAGRGSLEHEAAAECPLGRRGAGTWALVGEIAAVRECGRRWLGVRPRAAAVDPAPAPVAAAASVGGPAYGVGHAGEASWRCAAWRECEDPVGLRRRIPRLHWRRGGVVPPCASGEGRGVRGSGPRRMGRKGGSDWEKGGRRLGSPPAPWAELGKGDPAAPPSRGGCSNRGGPQQGGRAPWGHQQGCSAGGAPALDGEERWGWRLLGGRAAPGGMDEPPRAAAQKQVAAGARQGRGGCGGGRRNPNPNLVL
jgi:hypothetical protein